MENKELTYEYEVQENKLTLFATWKYSRKLRENDNLVIRCKEGSLSVNKKDLCKRLDEAYLPPKYRIYEELKARLNFYIVNGIQWQVEDTLDEIKDFKNKYLLIKNPKFI